MTEALPESVRKPFVVEPFSLGLRPGIDPDKISRFANELDDIEN